VLAEKPPADPWGYDSSLAHLPYSCGFLRCQLFSRAWACFGSFNVSFLFATSHCNLSQCDNFLQSQCTRRFNWRCRIVRSSSSLRFVIVSRTFSSDSSQAIARRVRWSMAQPLGCLLGLPRLEQGFGLGKLGRILVVVERCHRTRGGYPMGRFCACRPYLCATGLYLMAKHRNPPCLVCCLSAVSSRTSMTWNSTETELHAGLHTFSVRKTTPMTNTNVWAGVWGAYGSLVSYLSLSLSLPLCIAP
jgi:hypothetical protein